MIPKRKKKGGSLVEVMIATIITGVALIPVLRMLAFTATSYNTRAQRDIAEMLATELLVEISSKEFEDPSGENLVFGPDLDETGRFDFDDIDDYHLLNESPPLHLDGTLINGRNNYRRTVSIAFVDPNHPTSYAPLESQSLSTELLKHVTVNIFWKNELVCSRQTISSGCRDPKHSLEIQGTSTPEVSLKIRYGNQVHTSNTSATILNQTPREIGP